MDSRGPAWCWSHPWASCRLSYRPRQIRAGSTESLSIVSNHIQLYLTLFNSTIYPTISRHSEYPFIPKHIQLYCILPYSTISNYISNHIQLYLTISTRIASYLTVSHHIHLYPTISRHTEYPIISKYSQPHH
jgi:hypothetical protein